MPTAPVAAAMQNALEEPFQNAAPAEPVFTPEPAVEETPSFEPAFESQPQAEEPSSEPAEPAPAPFAAQPFAQEAPKAAPAFQPQSQGFQPQNQGFQPQGGFQPQNQGFQPQGGYLPQGGYQPQQPQKGKKEKAPKTNEPKKKKKTGLIIGIILGVLALAAAVFVLIKVLNKPKDPDPVEIDLNEYVTVEFEGYNGLGTVSKEEFDQKALLNDYEDVIQWTNAAKKNYKYVMDVYDSAADFALGYIFGSVEYTDDYFNLKNGDKVTWTWASIDADYISTLTNAVINAEDFEITVEGLQEVDLFDPFEGLDVSFSGTSGNGYCEYTQTNTEGVYADLYYWCDNNFDLKNGDEVRIYIDEWSDLDIQEKGMMPTRTELIVTVEGLPFYVTEFSDLPADKIAEMTEFFLDYMKSQIEGAGIARISDVSVSYEGSYYFILKEGSYSIDTNRLYHVFNVHFKSSGQNLSYYYYTVYTDMFIDADGNFSYYESTPDNYGHPTATFTFDDLNVQGYQTYSELETAIYDLCTDFDVVHTP